MPRRGRSASPPPAPRRAAAPPPSRVPAPAPPSTPMVAPGASQGPGLMAQMAATAGGVAIGSTVGHVVGHGITSMFSGGSDQPAPAQQQATAPVQSYQPAGGVTEPTGPCAWEIKQFLQCAQGQADLTLCEGFNEALRQCKASNHI